MAAYDYDNKDSKTIPAPIQQEVMGHRAPALQLESRSSQFFFDQPQIIRLIFKFLFIDHPTKGLCGRL